MEQREMDTVDVVVVGGGPAGLSAALVLGRACKRVWLCDAGARRNAAATHIHGFVTRDGTPPEEFRRIGREQLAPYDVTFREEQVVAVTPLSPKDGFHVMLEGGAQVRARRVLLALGAVDEPPALPGMGEAWGRSAFQCPHCHGWEIRGKAWGVLLDSVPLVDFAIMLTGWTRNVTALTRGAWALPPEARERLAAAGVRLETGPLERLVVETDGVLRGAQRMDGTAVPLDALFLKPKQHLPALVRTLGLALDDAGYVRVSPQCETSIPGLFAAGDVTTPVQTAIGAAYQGALTGWTMVHDLNIHAEPPHP
ncbi:NAD(P)/FAD-dependent oxidoreductase [Corallococcus sp. bb12-1]|uniref:NAD(P)/FAD-dependent oxidoreductase n=1 Tax=Corallococcus sp. bb12-1 TaxID=2996784 RepID=UPI00226D8A09|nr:NAD(P)/FAD-dependent oxidoreductase [Corallococcus sp. bb12-1]MCY1042765.1 NAD(P)/FAD-dependent oxidoreductase [Corallococcus sp. bb12-1]